MAYTVTADPTVAFVDAVKAKLSADTVLAALVTGIYGHLSEAARVDYPYIVLGRRHADNSAGAAMQLPGQLVTLQLDVWSDEKGPFVATNICSRIYRTLQRQPLTVSGFSLIGGSLERTMQDVFDEPDADKPGNVLYHGVQLWSAVIHESL